MSPRVWILALVLFAATPAAARTVNYAVIVGNNAPPAGSTLSPLRYADDDAVRYDELLSQFARTTLLATLDDATQKRAGKLAAVAQVPTLAAVRETFAALAKDMRRDRDAGDEPVLYFVFSGHGALAESGDAYLVFPDGRLTQRVLFDELIGSLPAPRTHVIVDACHAAAVVGARGVFDHETDGQTAPVTESEQLAIAGDSVLDRYPNVGVIAATTLGNETHEWSAIEAGVFSHEVMSGLSGLADANGDRVIEYSELEAFVASANRTIANPRASPLAVFRAPRVNRRSPLVALAALRGSYLVSGALGAWGRFSVELADGRRIVDANIARDALATIALPVGAVAFVRTATLEARLEGTGGAIAARDVRWTKTTVTSRGSADADYRTNLFSSAYGPAYYRGFVDSQHLASVDFDITLHVHADDLADDAPRAAPKRPWIARPRPWAYTLAGVAILSGGIATLAGVEAIGAKRDFDAAGVRGDAWSPAQRYEDASQVFWVSAGIAVAAGTGSWLLFRSSHHQVTVVPAVDPRTGSAGLSLQGRL